MVKSPCRSCRQNDLRVVHVFPESPYGDLYAESRSASTNLSFHPLTLSRCTGCGLLQLLHKTDLDAQYLEYLYFTRVTNKLRDLYENITKNLTAVLSLSQDDLIIDIGSNDGTFLSCFEPEFPKLLGVDPSRPACKIANEAGVETWNEYFGLEVAKRIKTDLGIPRLITINYTLANVPDLAEFFDSLIEIMDTKTFVNIVTGYHLDQFEVGMFDYVGHDHLTYLTIHDIKNLCEARGLEICYVRRHEHKGGSIEVGISRHDSTFVIEDSVTQMLQRERWLGYATDNQIYSMLARIELNKKIAHSILVSFQSQDRKIGGIGASISSTALLFTFGISGFFDCLYDDDPRKIGKFSPGTGIEVSKLEDVYLNNNSLVVVLSWQHTSKLMSRLKEVGYSGPVLVPMPEIELMSFGK